MSSEIPRFLTAATAAPVELTVRRLLAVWGYRARTPDSIGRIKRDLSDAGLRCEPDPGDGSLEDKVRVGTITAAVQDPGTDEDDAETEEAEEDQPLRLPHVFPRIGDIPSATAKVAWVRPSDSLSYAQSLMVDREYSQLAVMAGPYELVGAVSWRTIAAAKMAGAVTSLSQVIDHDPKVVRSSDSLLDQIETIDKADFVFVRAPDNAICGIVTTADLSARFRDLTTPFFQLGEIEHRLRQCVKRKGLTIEEIQQAAGKRVKSAEKMTFGNYVYLLKHEETWRKMGFEVDQEPFLTYLARAHEIRNRVAHYDANPVSVQDAEQLGKCLAWMRHLEPGPLG
jgi:restriction system protein